MLIVTALCVLFAAILQRRIPDAALWLLVLASFALGAARAGLAVSRVHAIAVPMDGKSTVVCEGVLLDDPLQREWGSRMDVRLSACGGAARALKPADGSVRLNARDYDSALTGGDRVRFAARFSLPREFKNPGAFSFRDYLAVHGIAAVGTAQGRVGKLPDAGAGRITHAFNLARKRVNESIAQYVSMPARATVEALATGSREDMTQELRDAFSLAGLSHLLAISGLHVGYVALAVYLLLRATLGLSAWLLARVPLPRLVAFITIPAVWTFVVFTGSAISAVRAALMITVYLAGIVLNLRQDLLTTIAASVATILILFPLSILDVSFQLSASAVVGIAIIAGPLSRWLRVKQSAGSIWMRAVKWISASAIVSLAATVATAPLVAYHFKIFTGIGLFANVIAIPLTGFVLEPLTLAGTLASLIIPSLAHSVWVAAGCAADALIAIARIATDIGAPFAGSWAPSAMETILAYAVIAAVLLWKRLPARGAWALSLATLVFVDVACWRMLPLMDQALSVTYFDVGQGDSALVRFPGGRTLLVDGGGLRGSDFDVGRNVLAPSLWRMGVRHIDWIVLTHPHQDHYGGLGYIAERFSPELVWTNGLDAPDEERAEWDAFMSRLAEARVRIAPLDSNGLDLNVNGSSLRILRQGTEAQDANDTSLAVIVSDGNHRFLFAGDMSGKAEASLLAKGEYLAADVLKAGHHGSADASSSRFLEAVRPAIAVISAGERNRYGLPHRDVLARLAAAGAQIYRTDRDGQITVKSGGGKISVTTFRKANED